MAVTEVLRGLGQWSVGLNPEFMPEDLWEKVSQSYFGHICIHVGRPDPRVSGDSLLGSSRYTGVYTGTEDAEDTRVLSGTGMAFWLGDAENKGDVREVALTFNAVDVDDAIRALLPSSGAVIEGDINLIPGETWSGSHQYSTPLQDIDYISQTKGLAWRVNGNATLDFGFEADLFVVDPTTFVVRKMLNGFQTGISYDMAKSGLQGNTKTSRDTEDFTTRVVLIAQDTEGSHSTAAKDILPGLNPYKDLFGNTVKLTRLVQESGTDETNADARAQLQLNRFTGTRDAISLSTSAYDVKGSMQVGDYLWVCDPLMDLVDPSNEQMFRGKLINPVKLRLTETTWPIVQGYSVMFRTYNGEWIDLTPYALWESGETSIVVGGYNRSLTGSSGTFPVTQPPVPDSSVPDVVVWDPPFRLGVYQSEISGEARGEVILNWIRPLNTDATTIVDGSHYEIRYRRSTVPLYPVTYDDIEDTGMTYDQLEATDATYDNPIVYPETEWQTAYAPFDVETFRLQELVTSMPYEAQIRAVDLANPVNVGAWSTLTTWQTTRDDIPPSTPAPPTIVANPMAVQMTHNLGASSGGTFNLERDLHHLELHGGSEPLFVPSDSTLLGKVLANWGMIAGEIPVVQTFQITSVLPVFFKVIAVDEAGNKSLPSAAVQMTAGLINDQYISNLTVSKITAGTMTASWILAGEIKTANTGARFIADINGARLYNPSNVNTVNFNANTGEATLTGKLSTGFGLQKIDVTPDSGDGLARIDIFDDGSTDHVTFTNFGGTYFQQRERNSDRARNGGFATYQSGSTFYGHQNVSGAESYISFNTAGGIGFKGYFNKTATLSGLGALYVDQIGGSGSSVVVTYGATMATRPLPFCMQGGTTNLVARGIGMNPYSTTGFTLYYDSAGNTDVLIWAVRYA